MDYFLRNRGINTNSNIIGTHFEAVTNTHINITKDDIKDFWALYCDTVGLNGVKLFLHEIVPENKPLPLCFLINLKFDRCQIPNNSSSLSGLVSNISNYITYVIGVIQSTLHNCFLLTEEYSEVIAVSLKRINNTLTIH